MESLVQWYAENGSALWTTIISFFGAYGVALFSLVVGIIRTKLAAIKQAELANERMAKIIADFEEKLDKVEKEVIEASNVNNAKRIEAMATIKAAVDAENEKLQPVEITDEVADALAKIN